MREGEEDRRINGLRMPVRWFVENGSRTVSPEVNSDDVVAMESQMTNVRY